MINLCQIWQCEIRIILLSQIHNNKIYSGYLEGKRDYMPLVANSVKMIISTSNCQDIGTCKPFNQQPNIIHKQSC